MKICHVAEDLVIHIYKCLLLLGTASVCLQNLRKTLKYGGRKNVPSVEEVTAVSAGRNSKRQMYRLPGGSETVKSFFIIWITFLNYKISFVIMYLLF